MHALTLHSLYSLRVRTLFNQLWSWITPGAWHITALILVATTTAFADTSNYRLGRGYLIGNTGIKLGGYADAHIGSFGTTPWSFEVSDLSLFVSWDNGSKLRFFSEIEIEDLLSAGEHRSLSTDSTHLVVERLYLDYLYHDSLTVRIGKILTPIGQWNLIHADPLVWTTTRPVATSNLFSKHANGIMLHGTLSVGEQALEYALYGDYSKPLDPKRAGPLDFDNAVGGRLRYSLSDDIKIGLSYVDFALLDSPATRNHLVGFDFSWFYKRFELSSEWVYRNNDSTINNSAWQGYIQGVSPLYNKLYAVGRYEFFNQTTEKIGQVGVVGLAYRPIPPLVWKLEYRVGANNHDLAPDGLFASFAVLF